MGAHSSPNQLQRRAKLVEALARGLVLSDAVSIAFCAAGRWSPRFTGADSTSSATVRSAFSPLEIVTAKQKKPIRRMGKLRLTF